MDENGGLQKEERIETQEVDWIKALLRRAPMASRYLSKNSCKVPQREESLHQDDKGKPSSSLNMDQVDVINRAIMTSDWGLVNLIGAWMP